MGDYYRHFLSSMAGVGGAPGPNAQDVPPGMQQPPNMVYGTTSPMPDAYQNLGYFPGFSDPVMVKASKSQRNRRKSASGPDHVKHRRTRSGCYTCRSRRVKCDETHPICERCRKGKRECVYPEPTQPKGSTSSSSKEAKDGTSSSQQASPVSSHGEDEDDYERDFRLDPIPDEDEDEDEMEGSSTQTGSALYAPLRRSSTMSASVGLPRVHTNRQSSESPSADDSRSMSPSAASGNTPIEFPVTGMRPDWSHLPQELQFYLQYYCDHITHFHYCMIDDHEDFYRTVLVGYAIHNEPLLYAVVGFAAYHHTLKNPNGRIMEFLQYYNRSVTLLLAYLKKRGKHSVATLLTILQLATIEEYLGDWVNLMGHQKAALEILTHLYTPQTAMQTQLSRMILTWYARFDVFIGVMGGFETSLPREWFLATVQFYDSKCESDPNNLAWAIKGADATLRLLSFEMSMLFGKGARDEISREEYGAEYERLARALAAWKDAQSPALMNPEFLVDVSEIQATAADALFQPLPTDLLFRPPLFSTTILLAQWHSISLMHTSQAPSGFTRPSQGSQEAATAICRICHLVEGWPHSINGSLIILQACLGMAALFVPRDPRYHMWIRRKFALLESMGYISPLTLRIRMGELFGDNNCVRWWLPDDESFTPILQSMRAFADERNATAVTAQSESLRDIRTIFAKLELGSGQGEQPAQD